MWKSVLALVPLFAVPPASAQSSFEITSGEAQSLAPQSLALRVLGLSGVLVEEASVHGDFLYNLDSIEFATRPRWAGYPHLCVADTYSVSFRPSVPGPEPVNLRDREARTFVVRRLDISKRYHALSRSDPLPAISHPSYRPTLDQRCAGAGHVLRHHAEPPPVFFTGAAGIGVEFQPRHAYFVAETLAAAKASNIPVHCVDEVRPSDGLCRNPEGLLKEVELEKLNGIYVRPCDDQSEIYCLYIDLPMNYHYSTIATIATNVEDIMSFHDPIEARGIAIRGVPVVD